MQLDFSAFSGANCALKLIHNFARSTDGGGVLVHVERDGTDARVAASSIALANLGQVHHRLLGSPWVRSDRNFYTKAALAKSHAIDGFGMQIVGNELVVTLEILIGDIEENRSVDTLGPLLQDFDGVLVAPEQCRQNEGV